jgi:hypothetical protein
VARLAGISLTVYLKSEGGWFAEEGSVEWVAVGVGDETLEVEGESSGVGVFSIIDGKVLDSPDFLPTSWTWWMGLTQQWLEAEMGSFSTASWR